MFDLQRCRGEICLLCCSSHLFATMDRHQIDGEESLHWLKQMAQGHIKMTWDQAGSGGPSEFGTWSANNQSIAMTAGPPSFKDAGNLVGKDTVTDIVQECMAVMETRLGTMENRCMQAAARYMEEEMVKYRAQVAEDMEGWSSQMWSDMKRDCRDALHSSEKAVRERIVDLDVGLRDLMAQHDSDMGGVTVDIERLDQLARDLHQEQERLAGQMEEMDSRISACEKAIWHNSGRSSQLGSIHTGTVFPTHNWGKAGETHRPRNVQSCFDRAQTVGNLEPCSSYQVQEELQMRGHRGLQEEQSLRYGVQKVGIKLTEQDNSSKRPEGNEKQRKSGPCSLLLPRLQCFAGDSSEWKGYIFNFEIRACQMEWSEQEKAEHLLALMRGKAAAFLANKPKDVLRKYKQLKEVLTQRYAYNDTPSDARRQLVTYLQEIGETLDEFSDRVMEKTRMAYPTVDEETFQSLAVDVFMSGCEDKKAAYAANKHAPRTLSDALGAVQEAKANLKIFGKSSSGSSILKVAYESTQPDMRKLSPQQEGLLKAMTQFLRGNANEAEPGFPQSSSTAVSSPPSTVVSSGVKSPGNGCGVEQRAKFTSPK